MSPTKNAKSNEDKKLNIVDKSKGTSEYNAFYKAEDGMEVKKVINKYNIFFHIYLLIICI